jgi:hypothetical protein
MRPITASASAAVMDFKWQMKINPRQRAGME